MFICSCVVKCTSRVSLQRGELEASITGILPAWVLYTILTFSDSKYATPQNSCTCLWLKLPSSYKTRSWFLYEEGFPCLVLELLTYGVTCRGKQGFTIMLADAYLSRRAIIPNVLPEIQRRWGKNRKRKLPIHQKWRDGFETGLWSIATYVGVYVLFSRQPILIGNACPRGLSDSVATLIPKKSVKQRWSLDLSVLSNISSILILSHQVLSKTSFSGKCIVSMPRPLRPCVRLNNDRPWA